jgi:hypothetical protein
MGAFPAAMISIQANIDVQLVRRPPGLPWVSLLRPKRMQVLKTLIEKIAGRRYQIGHDPAAEHQEGGQWGADRAMYQFILCHHGEIYEYDNEQLAWLCTSPRVANPIIRDLPEWMEIQVEADKETIFLFPIERVGAVMKWAKPRRKRILGEYQRKEASQRLASHRF